jgi:broad specificity phosphatase PhoE
MTRIIFVRHGETTWSKSQEHRFRGRIDIPLNDTGIFQAKAVGKHLEGEDFAAIYSSPLKRSQDTASEIAKLQNLPVLDHEGFIDLHFGEWQGELHETMKTRFPELYQRWKTAPSTMAFPGGETLQDVRDRIKKALAELTVKHENDTIVVVTHGAVLRVLLSYLNNESDDENYKHNMANCGISIIKFESGEYSIEVENFKEHL